MLCYFFSFFLSHHSHSQCWSLILRSFNIKNHSNYTKTLHFSKSNRKLFKLLYQRALRSILSEKYRWWQTKLKASEYITEVKITVVFHLLTYSYLPHFPTSTPLYFPLTLANLSRQWVVGIYFHLVVVLESPFSKQHDILKTSAKDIFLFIPALEKCLSISILQRFLV